MRFVLAPTVLVLALAASVLAESACTPLSGAFVATAELGCLASPVLLCTHGRLTGDLDGSYEFVMTTQQAGSDLSKPNRLTFTGESVIATEGGRMFAQDAGRMDVGPGPWPFQTVVDIHGGEGAWDGATGRLVADGALDHRRGVTEGTYAGEVCFA